MPKQRTGNDTHKKPEEPISNVQDPIIHGLPPSSGDERIRSDSTEKEATQPKKPRVINIGKIPKIDVIEGVEANEIAKSANRISKWSVFVSALLFGITLLIAYQAIKQSKAASDSVSLARQTYLADSAYKHKNDSLSKIADSIKKIRDDAIFNAQKDFYTNAKKGVGAQITQLQQTQSNFEKSNRAYLEAAEFNPIYNNKKELVAFGFYIVNKGSQPAKIISAYYSGLIDKPEITDTSTIKQDKGKQWEKYSDYVSIYAPGKKTIFLTPIVDTVRVKEMVMGIKNEYIYSESIYINLVTNKKTLYRFIAEINIQNGKVNYRFIQNDNIPLKK